MTVEDIAIDRFRLATRLLFETAGVHPNRLVELLKNELDNFRVPVAEWESFP